MKRWTTLAAVALPVALTVVACHDAAAPSSELRLPQLSVVNASKNVPITGSYIITLRDDLNDQDVDNAARSLARLHKGALKHIYKAALKGFAVTNLSDTELAALAQDPRVSRIEADQVVSVNTIQTPATWGLDRVDQRALPLNGSYTYVADGTGVTAYIIDTGIQITHTDFGGRASVGVDEVGDRPIGDPLYGIDCHGHGTHVSGTVAGTTYGLAKKASLVAVRVLDCSGFGSWSGIIAGLDWMARQQTCAPPPAGPGPKCGLPAVANMSLGGGFIQAVNDAVANAVNGCYGGPPCNPDDGVTVVVAAGNSTADACNYSPSSEPSAITVGATDINDRFASFSNRGTCVDISAPGVSVTSDWIGSSNTATNTISGTSMATPHVVGAAALYLSVNPGGTPAQVTLALTSNATTGVIQLLPMQTVNLLLYTGFIAAPLATITVTPNPAIVTSGATQQFTAVGKDAFGNTVTITPTWSVVAGGGAIDGNGLFTAGTVAGTYTNTVTATSNGVTGTATVTVTAGPLASIVVTPNPVNVSPYGTRQLTATGRDAFGNPVSVTPAWAVVNGGGTIDGTGLFKAGPISGDFPNTVQASSGTVSGTASVHVFPPCPAGGAGCR